MTAHVLSTELATLVQESKRKYPDLRNAAESSLNDLKAFPNTSEAQLAADLKVRPKFARPFVIACSTHNAKCAGSALTCLLRLILINGLSHDSLKDVLEAFRECVSLALDVQLKVLQALPLLLQNYGTALRGRLLIAAIQVCLLLQGSKTAVVSNTAAASLQQFLAFTFERLAISAENDSPDESLQSVPARDGSVSVSGAAADAYHILYDICLMAEGKEAHALHGARLNQAFAMELVESSLASHIETVAKREELVHVCRARLMPLVISGLSGDATFAVTVRAMRLLSLFTRSLLHLMLAEVEVAFNQLSFVLDPVVSPQWKRVLGLEIYCELHENAALVREMYSQYDEKENQKNIIGDQLSLLVRLASEKPAIIGLGQQLDQATRSETYQGVPVESIAVEPSGLAGAIMTSADGTNQDRSGLNPRWSSVRTRCLDQIDKTEAPNMPKTYIFALALRCINSFSDGLASFLLPFTVLAASKSKRQRRAASKKNSQGSRSDDDEEEYDPKFSIQPPSEGSDSGGQMPTNPLTLEDHPMYSQIRTSASMVDHCWPALLATASTFLNASLDSEYLHALIRSFQKFCQIAGLLELTTPRDAFLTALAKQAVPDPLPGVSRSSGTRGPDDSESDDDTGNDQDGSTLRAPIQGRNLLCLRALLNLGIALGPSLGQSWTIILGTLHQVDIALMTAETQSATDRRQVNRDLKDQKTGSTESEVSELETEKQAVDTAVSRLFQSTNDLPDQGFLHVLDCLSALFYDASQLPKQGGQDRKLEGSKLSSPPAATPRQVRFPSTSRTRMNRSLAAKEVVLLVDRLAHLAVCNSPRLSQKAASGSGWSIVVTILIDHLRYPKAPPEIRKRAVSRLRDLIIQVASTTKYASPRQRDATTRQCAIALATAVSSLWQSDPTRLAEQSALEVHYIALEALTSMLEQYGDIMRSGWESVFLIINSIFEDDADDERPSSEGSRGPMELSASTTRSSRLLRPSFTSLQLLCSDFLTSVPGSCFQTLLDTQYHFASQKQDFNISLTSVNLFRNTSDFLQQRQTDQEEFAVDASVAECETEEDLSELMVNKDRNISKPAIWVCILLQLGQLIKDVRPEVRHSALHTLFAIVDASSSSLSGKAWIMCFRLVFFKLLAATDSVHQRESIPQDASSDETAGFLVQGLSKCFCQAQGTMSEAGDLALVWKEIIHGYLNLLGRQRLVVSRAIFDSLAEILSVAGESLRTHNVPLDSAWAMWCDNNSSQHDLQGAKGNHEAIVAYLQYLQRIYGLLDRDFQTGQTAAILANLRMCIRDSTAVPYGSDIDEMTTIQTLVLEALARIPTSSSEIMVSLARELAHLVTLAAVERDEGIVKGKSFVALSRSAMEALGGLVKQQSANTDAPTALLLAISLEALSTRMRVKYNRNSEGKGSPLWKKATTTAVTLLDADLLRACQGSATDHQTMWLAIVDVGNGIAGADTDASESSADIAADEAFDMHAFSRLLETILPILGSPSILDKIRRKHVESIFQHSLVHEPHPDDLARPDQELLDGLRSQHVGRVQDLPPKSRSKMSYMLLDHLFHLAAIHDSSTERVKLAQAAAPYLILRAGLVLKAYVCDQPLRGRMPQPVSQRREMHHVLKRLVELESEPMAFPERSGVRSERKKHLFMLYGLVMKALKAARRDQEMSAALQEVLDGVGEDFAGF